MTHTVAYEDVDHTREGMQIPCPECGTTVFLKFLPENGCHECGHTEAVLLAGESHEEDVVANIDGDVQYAIGIAGNVRAKVEYDVPQVLVDAFGLSELTDCLEESTPTWTIRAVGEEDG